MHGSTHRHLGDRIRDARLSGAIALRENLTTREIARLAGTAECAVSNLENGHKLNCKVDTIIPIATVLGCSLDWLLLGRGDSPKPEEIAAAVRASRAKARRRAA